MGPFSIKAAPPAGMLKDGKTLAAGPERQQITHIYFEKYWLKQEKLQCGASVYKEYTCFRSFHRLSVNLRSFKELFQAVMESMSLDPAAKQGK